MSNQCDRCGKYMYVIGREYCSDECENPPYVPEEKVFFENSIMKVSKIDLSYVLLNKSRDEKTTFCDFIELCKEIIQVHYYV